MYFKLVFLGVTLVAARNVHINDGARTYTSEVVSYDNPYNSNNRNSDTKSLGVVNDEYRGINQRSIDDRGERASRHQRFDPERDGERRYQTDRERYGNHEPDFNQHGYNRDNHEFNPINEENQNNNPFRPEGERYGNGRRGVDPEQFNGDQQRRVEPNSRDVPEFPRGPPRGHHHNSPGYSNQENQNRENQRPVSVGDNDQRRDANRPSNHEHLNEDGRQFESNTQHRPEEPKQTTLFVNDNIQQNDRERDSTNENPMNSHNPNVNNQNELTTRSSELYYTNSQNFGGNDGNRNLNSRENVPYVNSNRDQTTSARPRDNRGHDMRTNVNKNADDDKVTDAANVNGDRWIWGVAEDTKGSNSTSNRNNPHKNNNVGERNSQTGASRFNADETKHDRNHTEQSPDRNVSQGSNGGSKPKPQGSNSSGRQGGTTTITPVEFPDRAAFNGDKCPTGKTKYLNGVCVDIDR